MSGRLGELLVRENLISIQQLRKAQEEQQKTGSRMGTALIKVGAIEESNATTVSAMTDMVTATRTFEAFQRVIEAFREADRRVVTTVPG